MNRFAVGHATHPGWQEAFALAAAQVDAQLARQAGEVQAASLGFVYLTDHYAAHADALYAALHDRWPEVAWVGAAGVGVCASGIEYFDEPALVLMVAPLASGRFRVFSGAQPLRGIGGAEIATALVHADSRTPDLPDLIEDLAARSDSGYLFGGLTASRTRHCHVAEGVFELGLSGVAFTRDVGIVSRVTQGCQPVGQTRHITACERNVVLELDGRPALECLLGDLSLSLDEPRQAMAVLRATLVGLASPRAPIPLRGSDVGARARHRAFGDDVRVRHLVGLDPGRHGVAVADRVDTGMTLAFCQRDVAAARRDLTRICAEIRDELAPETVAATTVPDTGDSTPAPDPTRRIAGAIYVSCAGRGGPHFGSPSAELQIVRHALGDVPLAGFFAAGEIGHRHLYGYTGVLTVFTRDA
ncbi:MAG: FIST C-terminal domain-containing protein [Aquincola sp.]|nr:FIST C-terminal domain-containing protein [Aquincola sp.]MDH4287635.1 FIST C-terminal domain-containing protein [Aquincola sp.]MDH5329483.1 FIST C-terminal domain-containing protein [Aquincola sp.]